VDQEVQLNFEKPLSSIGIPDEIKNNIKTQLIDSRIWIKATKAFKLQVEAPIHGHYRLNFLNKKIVLLIYWY
jgi:hypothetical protein